MELVKRNVRVGELKVEGLTDGKPSGLVLDGAWANAVEKAGSVSHPLGVDLRIVLIAFTPA
jgi:hypothetical protein